DLRRGSPAEEARKCSHREAVLMRAESHHSKRMSQRDRQRRRLQRTVLPGGAGAGMGFSWSHPRDDQSYLLRRGNDLEGAVLRTCVDHSGGARTVRSLREAADPMSAGTCAQTSSTWPEAAA